MSADDAALDALWNEDGLLDAISEALRPRLARMLADARAEALREAADEVAYRGWSGFRQDRDPLAVLRNQAGVHATAAHARGDQAERRRWLDVLILLDQHETTTHPTTPTRATRDDAEEAL